MNAPISCMTQAEPDSRCLRDFPDFSLFTVARLVFTGNDTEATGEMLAVKKRKKGMSALLTLVFVCVTAVIQVGTQGSPTKKVFFMVKVNIYLNK